MPHDRALRLGNQLREACIHDPLIGTGDLSVAMDNDVLSIRGAVANAAAKERIGELARRLAPGLAIDNGVVVSVTNLHDDATLAQRANSWIARNHPDLAAGMGVSVRQGKAILRGEWPSLAAVKAARAAFGSIPGIKAVDSASVTLPYRSTVPEAGLGHLDQRDTVNKIEEQMAKEGYRLGDWVDAHMYSGTVELTGVVDTWRDAEKVSEIAARTPGVRRVFNQVMVRQDSDDSGRQAEQRIRAAWGKPRDDVSAADLHVFVVGDRAYVTGEVDTDEAKRKALAMVRQDPAIKHVSDRITIVTRRERPKRGPGTTYRRRAG